MRARGAPRFGWGKGLAVVVMTGASLFVNPGVAHADLCYNPITGQFETCPPTSTNPPPTNPPPTNPPPTNPPPTNPPPTNPPSVTFPHSTTPTAAPTTPVTNPPPPSTTTTTATTIPVPTTQCPAFYGPKCPVVTTTSVVSGPAVTNKGTSVAVALPAPAKHHFSKPFLGAMILDGLLLLGIAGYVLARRIRGV